MYSVSEIGPAGATGIFRDRGRALGGHCDFARSSISSSWSYYRGYGKLTSALYHTYGDDTNFIIAQELYLNHIEFTPIFAHWLCNDCNVQLQSLLDVLPASQIAPYLLRLHDMGRAVQGGMTARRDEPEPESDGYDASLEAMFP